jgi:chemotaxis signal transduction protein
MTGHERVFIGRVGPELLAFALDSVREVIDAPVIQALPLAPEALLGHLTLRDAHLAVLDAGVLLGIPPTGDADGIGLVFAEGYALRLDDAVDVWERDAADLLPVPAGTDRVGLLRGLLRHDHDVAAFIDATALRARALATLREISHV